MDAPTSTYAAGAEEMLLRSSALHKRGKRLIPGSLCLTTERVYFADEAGDVLISIMLHEMANHFVTPPHAKQVALKFMTDEDERIKSEAEKGAKGKKTAVGTIIEFSRDQMAERDSFRDLISQLVPAQRRLKKQRTESKGKEKELECEEEEVRVGQEVELHPKGTKRKTTLNERQLIDLLETDEEVSYAFYVLLSFTFCLG